MAHGNFDWRTRARMPNQKHDCRFPYGRDLACAARRAVLGRARRVPALDAGSAAPAARRGRGDHCARRRHDHTFPARFTLVASMDPCPCGFRGDRASDCRCDDAAVQKYLAKLSGPLLDRIDLHVAVSRVTFDELIQSANATESSAAIRARVEAARERQAARFATLHGGGSAMVETVATNAAIPAAAVRRLCPLAGDALALLEGAITRGTLSARAFDRVARVARTIADLAACDAIARDHVAEALLYR
jgi:magnesium chelatase family protein